MPYDFRLRSRTAQSWVIPTIYCVPQSWVILTIYCVRRVAEQGHLGANRVQPFVRRSPHGKLCPLGQTASAKLPGIREMFRGTEHQVPGIDDAWYANAGSRPGVLYSDARSRFWGRGPTDFILLTWSPDINQHFGTLWRCS